MSNNIIKRTAIATAVSSAFVATLANAATLPNTTMTNKQVEQIKEFEKWFQKSLVFYSRNEYEQSLLAMMECLKLFPENKLAKKYYEIISDTLKINGDKVVSSSFQLLLFLLHFPLISKFNIFKSVKFRAVQLTAF